VVVPQSIFNSAQKDHGPYSVNCDVGKPCRERPSGGAAVMVQIYGGGYTEGDKISVGNPAGLIARSQENGTEGVIYVALNYRLGLFVSILPVKVFLCDINVFRDGYLEIQMSQQMQVF
jgi:hypothetical protein